MTKLLRRPEVEEITRLSRAAIYAKMQEGTFPEPVRLGSNSVAWRAADIEAWIESPSTGEASQSRWRRTPCGGGVKRGMGIAPVRGSRPRPDAREVARVRDHLDFTVSD